MVSERACRRIGLPGRRDQDAASPLLLAYCCGAVQPYSPSPGSSPPSSVSYLDMESLWYTSSSSSSRAPTPNACRPKVTAACQDSRRQRPAPQGRSPTCPATPLRLDPRLDSPNSRLLASDSGLNRSTCSAAPRPCSARPGSRPRYPRP